MAGGCILTLTSAATGPRRNGGKLMPRSDYANRYSGHPEGSGSAAGLPSRRALLRTAAGTGAAGLVAGTGLTAWAAQAQAAGRAGHVRRTSAQGSATAAQPFVVHVRDLRTGEMDIFAGTSQARLRDQALAARLARAAQRPGAS